MSGTVITFYSYKGGVGRSQALTNVAALMSKWGYRVLCVDWDLEAPGLHLYFKPWISGDSTKGLVELITDNLGDSKTDWRSYVTPINLPETRVPLSLIKAGRQDADYVKRVQSIHWEGLYAKHDLGNVLENLRNEWKTEFDFILIDSRTGITDIGGICTIQMPDQLALFSTANDQSVMGILDVARRAQERRNSLPFDRAAVACVPIVTRFDARVESGLAKQWLARFAEEFAPLYGGWLHRGVSPRDILNFLKVPYVATWSFGEKLPVIEEGTRDPESIGFAFETLAALFARGLADTDVLVRQRDSWVETARRGPAGASPTERFDHDVYISYPPRAADFARHLHDQLIAMGIRADLPSLKDFKESVGGIERKLKGCRNFLFLIANGDFRSDSSHLYELRIALNETLLEPNAARRILPILLPGATPKDVPSVLQQFQFMRIQDDSEDTLQQVASEIAELMMQPPTSSPG